MKKLLSVIFTVILSCIHAAPDCYSVSFVHITGYVRTTAGLTDEGVAGAVVRFTSTVNDTAYTTVSGDGGWFGIDLPIDSATGIGTTPEAFSLHQNYPNPFNPSTVIEYDLPRGGHVSLQVFNALGQLVRELERGYVSAGRHSVVWNTADDAGKGVAAGIYLYRLRFEDRTITRKMLLMDGGGLGGKNGAEKTSAFSSDGRESKAKRTGSRSYVMTVSHGDYVTYEDYRFVAASYRHVDVELTRKTGITITGTVSYNPCHRCREDNGDGVIDPVTVIVYDTNDYSVPYGVITLDYPDTTYELTGLDECTVDIVFQGDDIVSRKMSEIGILADFSVVPDNTLNILYDMDLTVSSSLADHTVVASLKKEYDTPETAENILSEEYGCKIYQIQDVSLLDHLIYYCYMPEGYDNSARIMQLLNNDRRILHAGPFGTFDLTGY